MSDDFPGDEDKSPMPEERFPDGFGMSVEDVRALLAKKHDVSVPQDDPILMQVTILQVFLEAQARLQKKHETALAAFMGQQTTAYVKDMEKSLTSLTETLSGLTMEGIRKAVADFVANLATHRSAMYLCTAIIALSAFSMSPLSRRSESMGLQSALSSHFLLNCESAKTGQSKSFARRFSPRLISPISLVRFSPFPCISCR